MLCSFKLESRTRNKLLRIEQWMVKLINFSSFRMMYKEGKCRVRELIYLIFKLQVISLNCWLFDTSR